MMQSLESQRKEQGKGIDIFAQSRGASEIM